jgi:hypothetical protein
MSGIVEENPSSRPFIYFGAYCFGGVSLLSYFTYRGFTRAMLKTKVNRPSGEKLALSKMGAVGGLWKAGLAMGVYVAGFVYLAMNLNLGDRAVRSFIEKDEQYTSKIKLDPLFQNFYVLNIMRFFGISERLIKKTEEELRAKVEAGKGEGVKQNGLVEFERQVIYLTEHFGGQKEAPAEKPAV